MFDPKSNRPKIPPELYETLKRVLAGDYWAKDKPNILSPDNLFKIRIALEQGLVFGRHLFYYGGCSADDWGFLDFNQFREYLAQSRPGDLYYVWSVKDLIMKKLVLAHGNSSESTRTNSLPISLSDIQKVKNYLSVPYNEVIIIFILWNTKTVTIDLNDIDGFEDLEGDIRNQSHPNSEIYIFPFTDIDKPEHYLLEAKYPNEKGEVSLGGAY